MYSISIIIPVYNTERYLAKCLDSAVNQSCRNIEIICVDDASSDNSLTILKEYSKKDSRVKIIEFKKNQGVAIARNQAIKIAQGEYITFLDSDDSIESDFCEKLLNKANESSADVVKGNYRFEDGFIDYTLNKKIEEYKTNFCFDFCSALYKASLLKENNITFPEGLKDMEDPLFTFKCALLANKVEVVDDAIINITKRENSATFGIPNAQQVASKFSGLKLLFDFVKQSKIPSESFGFIFAYWFFYCFSSSIQNREVSVREFIVTQALELFSALNELSIDYFKKELDELDKSIYSKLSQCDREALFYYLEDNKINEQSLQIEKLRETNKALVKQKNEVFARYVAPTLRKKGGE